MDEIRRQVFIRLEKEAAGWVEEELDRRMAFAKGAIEEQVLVALPEIGARRAGDHRKKAMALAEREIRLELEFVAQKWVEQQMEKRQTPGGDGLA